METDASDTSLFDQHVHSCVSSHNLLWSLTSYWTTRVLPVLSIVAGNLAEMAWWAAAFFTTRPESPSMPL